MKSGLVGPVHTRTFQAPSAFSLKYSMFGVGFQLQRPPVRHQCTGSRRKPRPSCSYGEQWTRGETRKRCFPEQTRIGAELGFPRRVSLSQMKLPEPSFVPFLRWALGVSLPSWRNMGCWGQCTQGLFWPHPPSPQRSAHLELVSISRDHQHSTSAKGAVGSTEPPWP